MSATGGGFFGTVLGLAPLIIKGVGMAVKGIKSLIHHRKK
jgi:hypothetical protein